MKLKNLAKKITAFVTAATFGFSLNFFTPISTAEAMSTGDAINIGAAIIIAQEQRRQLNQQIDVINNTDEGRQALYSQFRQKYGVNEDPELNARLDRIMANLTAAVAKIDPTIKDKPYLYFVANQETLNAACSVGHIMMVNMGTLYQVHTDDELAAIVGHEMGHGQKDHVVKSAKRQINEQMIAQIGVSAIGGTNLAAVAGTILLNHSLANSDRKAETEADNLAWEYILQSDYNIGAPAAVMQKFVEMEKTQGGRSGLQNLFNPSDHPESAKRRDNYAKKLYEYSGKHAEVKKGIVNVNGKVFLEPAATDKMSSWERAYFVLGNLAAAYHKGFEKNQAIARNGVVYLGEQPIIESIDGDEPAEILAARLNEIK